jgi:hypothetical protein
MDTWVMEKDRMVVRCETRIRLDDGIALIHGGLIGGKGVFGKFGADTAMSL